MSMYYVPIAQCPFCEEADGGGHVLVDAAALSKERMSANERSSPSGDNPDERIFLFNTDREKTGPCEHLLGLWCDVVWGRPRDDYEMLTFDWEYSRELENPRLRELHNDELAAEFFWDEVYDMGKSHIRPETSCHPSGFYTQWHDISDPQSTGHYYAVEGRILFVENIDDLMGELHQRGVEYQKWMTEQMLLEKKEPGKDDDEYEYEYEEVEVEVGEYDD